MSGILKRKFEEVNETSLSSSLRESDDEISSSDSADSADSINPSTSNHFTPSSILKREKRIRTKNVRFDYVTVYYFTRRQGFTSVPSQGGSTLGMSNHHSSIRQYTLGEFALEQERLHRKLLRDHLKEEKLNLLKLKMTKNGTVESDEASTLTLDDISDDDIDLDNTEVDEYFFLQPLPTKKRRALLRASGVKRIDVEEKHELRAIRLSREDCGCDCQIFCDPELCSCSLAGIKCQVDRMSFPCGCTKEGCSNTAGRIEFNPIRVRTHFLHTIMKMELEKNKDQHNIFALNGCQSEATLQGNTTTCSQPPLEYSIAETFGTETEQQTAVLHLQSAEEMDQQGEEDEEEEEDASSFCSGVTDSSTQSLPASESDEDEEEEEEEEEDEKGEGYREEIPSSIVSHTEVVPITSVLCYSDGSTMHENHSDNASYYGSSPAVYYQIDSHSSSTADQPSEAYREIATKKNGSLSLLPYSIASEPYTDYAQVEHRYGNHQYSVTNPSVIVCCSSEHDSTAQCNGVYHEQNGVYHEQNGVYHEQRHSHPHMELQTYLNNASEDGYGLPPNSNCDSFDHCTDNSKGLSDGIKSHDSIKSSVVETVSV
ncbi:cysteine/serine-rich nuclear protein 3 [Protopterus annectens]|uniref:cysteine/serine-rich nuclear protein 3 n=1 Tax=Protopterus annectens TaxID=7888 RepID=UPI001CF95B5D|nr:cysteine/serine-rich nuclear protein 3 [Protopterus annectens]